MSRPHSTKTAAVLWIVILLSLVAFVFLKLNTPKQIIDQSFSVRDIRIAEKNYSVYEARTPIQREIGLSAFNSIKDNEGMLFYFDDLGRPAFWMKNMKFPIDIIWLKDWTVIQITPDIAVEPNDKFTDYLPQHDVNEVLEIKAGQSQKDGIKVGDVLELK